MARRGPARCRAAGVSSGALAAPTAPGLGRGGASGSRHGRCRGRGSRAWGAQRGARARPWGAGLSTASGARAQRAQGPALGTCLAALPSWPPQAAAWRPLAGPGAWAPASLGPPCPSSWPWPHAAAETRTGWGAVAPARGRLPVGRLVRGDLALQRLALRAPWRGVRGEPWLAARVARGAQAARAPRPVPRKGALPGRLSLWARLWPAPRLRSGPAPPRARACGAGRPMARATPGRQWRTAQGRLRPSGGHRRLPALPTRAGERGLRSLSGRAWTRQRPQSCAAPAPDHPRGPSLGAAPAQRVRAGGQQGDREKTHRRRAAARAAGQRPALPGPRFARGACRGWSQANVGPAEAGHSLRALENAGARKPGAPALCAHTPNAALWPSLLQEPRTGKRLKTRIAGRHVGLSCQAMRVADEQVAEKMGVAGRVFRQSR
jgi:hypothetical protein